VARTGSVSIAQIYTKPCRCAARFNIYPVIPQEYHEFFAATASATGALIGLLFVAVSVHPGQARQAQTRVTFHNRASAALLVFTNALVLSLAALVPGTTLGWWAIVMSASVLIFAAATIRSIVANARHPSRRQGSLGVVIALLIIAGFELYAGIRLVGRYRLRSGVDVELGHHRRSGDRNQSCVAIGGTT
jgi:hypothetical protein